MFIHLAMHIQLQVYFYNFAQITIHGLKRPKKMLGCAQDFRLENCTLVERIDKAQTLSIFSMESLGRVCAVLYQFIVPLTNFIF